MFKLAGLIASSTLAILLGVGTAVPLPPPSPPLEDRVVGTSPMEVPPSIRTPLPPASNREEIRAVETPTPEVKTVLVASSIPAKYEALSSGAFRILCPDRTLWNKISCSVYENGARNEVGYVDDQGRRHGRWTKYHPETGAVLWEGWYDHGLKSGLWTFYTEEGRVEVEYQNGIKQ